MKAFACAIVFGLLAGTGVHGAPASTPSNCSSDSCAGESRLPQDEREAPERLAQAPQSPFAPTEEQKRQQAAETKRQAEEKRAKEEQQRARAEQRRQAREKGRGSWEQQAKQKEEERRREEEMRLRDPEAWEDMRRWDAEQAAEQRRLKERRGACTAECSRDRPTMAQCIVRCRWI